MADALARIRARRSARIVSALPTTRSCEGCDLCCTAPGIRELGKPPAVPCGKLCGEPGRSCSIYASRPSVCRDFYCLWRITDKILPDWMRPADCGFVLAANNLDAWPAVVTVHPDPQRPDAWRTLWHQTVFSHIAERWNCLVAIGQSPTTTHIFTPNGMRLTVGEHPTLIRDDGFVGAPDFCFGPDQRPLREQMRETVFSWGIAPPDPAKTGRREARPRPSGHIPARAIPENP
jgi:uncharacterized cysteine cluster protein YcgN (CxxCxxCC family)